MVQASSDKTASELALERIKQEKKVLHSEYHVQVIMLNLSQRNNDRYHFELDHGIIERIGLYEFSSKANEEVLLKLSRYCGLAIQYERKRYFPDKYWIDTFTEAIKSISEVIPKLRELQEQEEYHRKIIAS